MSKTSLETVEKPIDDSRRTSGYQREELEEEEELQIHHSEEQDQAARDQDLEKQVTHNTLEKQYSHLSQPARPDIPNGGLTAWLQVVAGFFLFFNTWLVVLNHRRQGADELT